MDDLLIMLLLVAFTLASLGLIEVLERLRVREGR